MSKRKSSKRSKAGRQATPTRQPPSTAQPQAQPAPVRELWLPAAIIALVTIIAFSGVRHHDFVDWDDVDYITSNDHVTTGLTAENVQWAWTSTSRSNWHPLTWMSHQLDWQLYGDWAGGHKITAVALHILTALLLLGALHAMTGSRWRSAVVAALFAIHPLHVESVAWVSERKDILSAMFGFAAIWAYAWYARRNTINRYLPVVLLYACSLASKSMLVTLPFVLLLLDVWPLRRPLVRRVLLEKIPLLAMALGCCIITVIAQTNAISSIDALPLSVRLPNAIVAVARYLGKMVWPTHLSYFYPYPAQWHGWQVAAALLLIAGVTFVAVRCFKCVPAALVGWLWFLGTLVPVVGIVQVGAQSMAERYTYVPLVGVFIAIAWSLPARMAATPTARRATAAVAGIILAALCVVTWQQVAVWRDTRVLYTHALEVNPQNHHTLGHLGGYLVREEDYENAEPYLTRAIEHLGQWARPYKELAVVRREQGRSGEALELVTHALRLHPNYAVAHYLHAELLEAAGDLPGAIAAAQAALAVDPTLHEAHNMLGNLLGKQHHVAEAAEHFRMAIAMKSDEAGYRFNFGRMYVEHNKPLEATRYLQQALEMDPKLAEAHHHMGIVAQQQGRFDDALGHYATAVQLDPDNAMIHANVGVLHFNLRDYAQAQTALGRAVDLNPDNADYHLRFGRNFEAQNRPANAAKQYREAIRLDPDHAQAHNALGALLARDGNVREAAEHFAIAVRIDPTNRTARDNLEKANAILERSGR